MSTPILQVEDIQKYYGNRGNLTKAISHISFQACRGEFLIIYANQFLYSAVLMRKAMELAEDFMNIWFSRNRFTIRKGVEGGIIIPLSDII